MQRADYKRTLFSLCLEQEAPSAIVESIATHLNITIPQITPTELHASLPQQHRHKILLLNYQTHTLLRQQASGIALTSNHYEIILFNVTKRLTTEELLTFGNLKGLFYQDDELTTMAQDCAEIINGQNRLPRNVMCQLLYYYRHVMANNTVSATVDITARELQILRCLQTGSSNQEIAENLFISEYTVKSHLYQIFKKLSVRNRLQAIAWADQNLLN